MAGARAAVCSWSATTSVGATGAQHRKYQQEQQKQQEQQQPDHPVSGGSGAGTNAGSQSPSMSCLEAADRSGGSSPPRRRRKASHAAAPLGAVAAAATPAACNKASASEATNGTNTEDSGRGSQHHHHHHHHAPSSDTGSPAGGAPPPPPPAAAAVAGIAGSGSGSGSSGVHLLSGHIDGTMVTGGVVDTLTPAPVATTHTHTPAVGGAIRGLASSSSMMTMMSTGDKPVLAMAAAALPQPGVTHAAAPRAPAPRGGAADTALAAAHQVRGSSSSEAPRHTALLAPLPLPPMMQQQPLKQKEARRSSSQHADLAEQQQRWQQQQRQLQQQLNGGSQGAMSDSTQQMLQTLRLSLAAAIADGTGPGIASLRGLGFVRQMQIVDELTLLLAAQRCAAPAPVPPSSCSGLGLSQCDAYSVTFPHTLAAPVPPPAAAAGTSRLCASAHGGGDVQAAAAAAAARSAVLMPISRSDNASGAAAQLHRNTSLLPLLPGSSSSSGAVADRMTVHNAASQLLRILNKPTATATAQEASAAGRTTTKHPKGTKRERSMHDTVDAARSSAAEAAAALYRTQQQRWRPTAHGSGGGASVLQDDPTELHHVTAANGMAAAARNEYATEGPCTEPTPSHSSQGAVGVLLKRLLHHLAPALDTANQQQL
jgi:hypothetical protein